MSKGLTERLQHVPDQSALPSEMDRNMSVSYATKVRAATAARQGVPQNVSRALDSLYLSTLKWVQKIQTQIGMPPVTEMPKGVPGEECSCTLSKCFTDNKHFASVEDDHLVIITEFGSGNDAILSKMCITLPERVVQFYETFDWYWYPDLISTSVTEEQKRKYNRAFRDRDYDIGL